MRGSPGVGGDFKLEGIKGGDGLTLFLGCFYHLLVKRVHILFAEGRFHFVEIAFALCGRTLGRLKTRGLVYFEGPAPRPLERAKSRNVEVA